MTVVYVRTINTACEVKAKLSGNGQCILQSEKLSFMLTPN